MTVQARITLAQAVLPRSGLLRDALLILAFSLFIGLCAQISFRPFPDIPITGQTLGVLLSGAVLGSKRGGLALVAYLGEGLAGLPVFSSGTSAWSMTSRGVPVIIGPTAGFLIGFMIAAFVVGWLAERGWDRNVPRLAAALLAGNLLLYVPGVTWFSSFVGTEAAFTLGVLPFIPGDIFKLVLVASAVPGAWALLGRSPSGAAGPPHATL